MKINRQIYFVILLLVSFSNKAMENPGRADNKKFPYEVYRTETDRYIRYVTDWHDARNSRGVWQKQVKALQSKKSGKCKAVCYVNNAAGEGEIYKYLRDSKGEYEKLQRKWTKQNKSSEKE